MKRIILLLMLTICVCTFASAQVPQLTDNAVQGSGLNQHNYVGSGWVHGNRTTVFYNGTLSFSSVTGSYLTFTFESTKIEWYTEKRNTHGIAAVSIDGGAETMVDLYSVTEQHVLVYSSPVLTRGTHTIKIRATGTKNAASSGYYAIHDYFKTYPSTLFASTNLARGNVSLGSDIFTPSPNYWTDRSTNTTAIGYNALGTDAGAQGSTANTAVGAYALYATAGVSNTAIGAGSGPVEGKFLLGTTALGAGAKTTADFQVRIGSPAVLSIGGQVSWSTLSDGRFKRELREDVSGLEFVNNLRPVSYLVDKAAVEKFLGVPDSISSSRLASKEKPIRQTGFVAQEVDALVKKTGYVFSGVDAPKNEKDPYTIRYAEFVVPLVKAVQELSAKSEEQQKQIDQLLEKLGEKEEENSGLKSTVISLLQNNPNPFSVNTEIKMVLPETVGSAIIIVYNLEGKQLKTLQVKGRGNTSVSLLSNELSAGMYIYALIADGKVVDTKRMILTK